MGKLTTHVLDISVGKPASGMTIELWKIDKDGERTKIVTVKTNIDGRTNDPLIEGETMKAGEYMLVFYVRDYFKTLSDEPNPSPFLNTVPVQFTISNPIDNYHVPLVMTPWAYSTYRGS